MPEFRTATTAYYAAMEAMTTRLVPIVAMALDLPPDHFAQAFEGVTQSRFWRDVSPGDQLNLGVCTSVGYLLMDWGRALHGWERRC
jgi:hypothetical protein